MKFRLKYAEGNTHRLKGTSAVYADLDDGVWTRDLLKIATKAIVCARAEVVDARDLDVCSQHFLLDHEARL